MTCWIDQSSGYCATGKIYDGDIPGSSLNYQSAMSASIDVLIPLSSAFHASGKTAYW